MFDLTLTPAQRSWLAPNDTREDELRALARAAEHDRKPPIELQDMILAGRFPMPVTDTGAPDPLAIIMAAGQFGHADPGVALTIVGSWHAPLLLAAAGRVSASDHEGLTSALIYEGFGRQPSEFTTTARRIGDDWILTGRKDNVLHPGLAEHYIVVAREFDAGDLAAFVVDGSAQGLTVERDDALDGKLGLRAAHTGVVRLNNVRVTHSQRLIGDDALSLARAIGLCRLTLAGIAIGCARASLEYAIEWAKVRSAFGKLIASYQGVSFVLADLATSIDNAELLVWDAVARLDDITDVAELEHRVSRAVARATTAATEAGRQGVNVLGVHGIVTEHPVERWYRGAAALSTIDFDPLSVALEVS